MTHAPAGYFHLLRIALGVIALAAPADSQMMPTTQVKREDTSFLVRIPAADMTCAAVSDAMGLLALGRTPGTPGAPTAPQVSVYRLDAQGLPGAQPLVSFDLPRPAELPAERQTMPLSLVFHPRLPVLYVWQRTVRPREDDEKWDAVYDRCHPLLVVRIEGEQIHEQKGVELGARVDEGNPVGFIALDEAARRLYVPNLRQPRTVKGEDRLIPGVGYLELDEAGQVVLRDGKPALHATFSNVFHRDQIAGGFVPVSDERVIIAGTYGPLSWNLADLGQRFQVFYTWPPRYQRRIGGHPTLPIVYMTADDQGYVYCFRHVQGVVTLLPQISYASGPFTPPVVLDAQRLVAFGGVNLITVFELAEDGRFTGQFSTIPTRNPRVQALVYSRRFSKLYVTETSP